MTFAVIRKAAKRKVEEIPEEDHLFSLDVKLFFLFARSLSLLVAHFINFVLFWHFDFLFQ